MKITRALLLSSEGRAESYECEPGFLLFRSSAPRIYRFLVTKDDDELLFQIFRMVDERYEDYDRQQRTRRVAATVPHVAKTFKDAGELINFLRRHQIDFESIWQPVESE